MSTDKEIRKFIKDNMPDVKGSDRFMSDLVRQIELLPVPSSLSGKSEEDIQASKSLVMSVARQLKRRSRIRAVLAAVSMMAVLMLVVGVLYFFPEAKAVLDEYYLYISVAFSAVVLAATLYSFRYYSL